MNEFIKVILISSNKCGESLNTTFAIDIHIICDST